MEPISNQFTLNKAESARNLRDSLVVLMGALVERGLDLVLAYDFGAYEYLFTVGVTILAVVLNRWVNILRVNEKGQIT